MTNNEQGQSCHARGAEPMSKQYLGDGVYADFDEYGLVLTTESSVINVSNTIYLEPKVQAALVQFIVEQQVTASAIGERTGVNGPVHSAPDVL